MTRLRPKWLTLLCMIAIVTGAALAELAVTPQPAHAQDRPLTLFDLLFGRRQASPPSGRSTNHGARPSKRHAPSSSGSGAPTLQSAPPTVSKLDNAREILVVGDFTAGALADGLTQAFANSPGVKVVDRSNGSSGFVRNDYYDWPSQIKPMLEEEKPAVVVVMIGSNDRQQLKVDGNREQVRSPAWTAEYTRRVTAFADIIHDSGYRLVWVGQPSYKWSSMSADMIAFNDIYRAATQKVGGTFVDIWDGFVDDAGNFTTTGFDIDGQTVRLRSNDGINFTKAAKRKIAFYAEKPLRQILGRAASPDIASLSPDSLPTLTLNPASPSIQRVPPISLDDPSLDGSERLFGASLKEPAKLEKSLRDKLVQDGIPPASQPGRVDDFSWPPRPVAHQSDETPTTGAISSN